MVSDALDLELLTFMSSTAWCLKQGLSPLQQQQALLTKEPAVAPILRSSFYLQSQQFTFSCSLSQWLTDISRWSWTPKHLLTFPHFIIYTISVNGSSVLKISWSRGAAVTVTSCWPSLPYYITSNLCCHFKIDLDALLLLPLEISGAVWIFVWIARRSLLSSSPTTLLLINLHRRGKVSFFYHRSHIPSFFYSKLYCRVKGSWLRG